ncbi:MAG: twin-arginine translocase subunit TatB [Gammaproteobacteria bacterium]|nr:twin-arginine translocase subunit TatB [Gammaproteobacteria bacterium]MBD3775595.1 twin-arginine translocase subunit TatB [Thiotrichales bacterium]
MFDIGFLELLLVLVIALIVIGPERMPEVARKLGSFMGKTRRFINSMKEDNEWQDTVRELKAAVDMQEEKKQLKELELDLQTSLQEPAHDIDFESLSRPSFGGTPPPVESPTQSQFSKAPQQPQFPPKAESIPGSAPQNPPASATTATQSTTQSAPAETSASVASASSAHNAPEVRPTETKSS